MAAVDTFEWLVREMWPDPDVRAQEFIADQRKRLLDVRIENERLLFLDLLMEQLRSMKPHRVRRPQP